ncbi:unnamed protein product [Prunus brigantina]
MESVCSKEEKRTVPPEHVLKALRGFDQPIWAYFSVSNLAFVLCVVSLIYFLFLSTICELDGILLKYFVVFLHLIFYCQPMDKLT